ncbi:TetR/AcrR family transcriptional regulator [Streptomyces sp. J2-1]|nr:TetR/AcrR family transcriptional regulator [Streptomyces corallincola]
MAPATPSAGPGETRPGTPRRKDARRNHERVVAAAVAVFREQGTLGSVPQIAARAEVGKATVYRSFPTKEDLLEAVTRLSLAELERGTAEALRDSDPYGAFRGYVLRLFDALAHDRLLAERLADSGSPAAASVLRTLLDAMNAAKATGELRPDASRQDLLVVLCGTALQLVRSAERDPATWHRYGEMVINALRP